MGSPRGYPGSLVLILVTCHNWPYFSVSMIKFIAIVVLIEWSINYVPCYFLLSLYNLNTVSLVYVWF